MFFPIYRKRFLRDADRMASGRRKRFYRFGITDPEPVFYDRLLYNLYAGKVSENVGKGKVKEIYEK